MIRFLINKSQLPSTLGLIKSQIYPSTRRFATEITKSAQKENFVKDIIVYSYENPRLFKVLNLFSISQLFFWGYLGNWAYTEMKSVEVNLKCKFKGSVTLKEPHS